MDTAARKRHRNRANSFAPTSSRTTFIQKKASNNKKTESCVVTQTKALSLISSAGDASNRSSGSPTTQEVYRVRSKAKKEGKRGHHRSLSLSLPLLPSFLPLCNSVWMRNRHHHRVTASSIEREMYIYLSRTPNPSLSTTTLPLPFSMPKIKLQNEQIIHNGSMYERILNKIIIISPGIFW